MKMSDSEGEFVCSQVSIKEYSETQSSDYGGDVDDDEVQIGGNVVSLEGNRQANLENCVNKLRDGKNSRVIYDKVQIEDISDDEQIDNM